MNRATTRRGLQVFLLILGAVAAVAGGLSVLFGVGLVPGHGEVIPSVDSEMRFYAAWYAAAGIIVLRAVPRVESATTTIRAVAGVLFVAGCSRLLSLAVVGRPHALFVVLMIVELVLPPVILTWQSALARWQRPDRGER